LFVKEFSAAQDLLEPIRPTITDLSATTERTMSPLAEIIYDILRRRTGLEDPRITYAELAEQARDRGEEFEWVHHRNRQLYAALVEVGEECRRLRLPPLPALVVRADTRRPGDAYYEGKCRGRLTRGDRIAVWREDLEAVQGTAYPPREAGKIPAPREDS
jgi:hypothetical protein